MKIGDYIVTMCRQSKITAAELSRQSGVESSHLYRILKNEHEPQNDTLDRIAKAFGLRSGDMWVGAGYTAGVKHE